MITLNKKACVLAAVVSALASGSVFAADATGTDQGSGRIHFTGTVINAPCSIAPGDEDINVNLGQIANKVLEAGNKYSQNVSYTIHLQDCSLSAASSSTGTTYKDVSKVQVKFAGATNANNADLLANTGGAAGVGIRLIDANGALLKVGDTSASIGLVNGNNELTFAARAEADGTAVQVGPIKGQATYSLNYL